MKRLLTTLVALAVIFDARICAVVRSGQRYWQHRAVASL
jgi:hypothetical protein